MTLFQARLPSGFAYKYGLTAIAPCTETVEGGCLVGDTGQRSSRKTSRAASYESGTAELCTSLPSWPSF